MPLDLPLRFPLFGRLHIKEFRPKLINVNNSCIRTWATTCGLDVVATFSTYSMFCVVDFRAGAKPNVANPPFLKKKKRNLKIFKFFQGAMDPTNCNHKTNKQ
jgi:hypothetical protein